jgi:hypothetical protein
MQSLAPEEFWGYPTANWALGVAFVAILLSLYTTVRNEMERHARRRRAESEQARLVYMNLSAGGGTGINGHHVSAPHTLTVRNDSPDAIRNVHMRLVIGPPTVLMSHEGHRINTTIDLIASGDKAARSIAPDIVWSTERNGAAAFTAEATVEFTDAEGRRWRRSHDHSLTRLSD